MNFKLKISKNILFLLFLCTISLFIQNQTIIADESGLTYSVAVKNLPNQIDKKATYYDLLVTPGQQQTLTVVVTNSGKEEKNLVVTPTNAITNQNGVIDYSIQDSKYKYDSTLKIPFTSLVGEPQKVKVAPGESKEVNFELNIPKDPFNGVILGGFVVSEADSKESNQKSDGVKIVNKFQIVKAVKLREKEEKIPAELVLNDVKPALVSYRTAVTANLQNTEPISFGQMKVDAKITEKGKSEVLKSQVKENLEMAPNSNFDFPIMWGNQKIKAGDYTLTLVATSGDRKWSFKKDFVVTAEESKKINSEAVELEDSPSYWIYIVAVIGLIILAILIYLYVKKKKNKETSSF